MTSSRIEFSSVLAPSANRATSSNVDPVAAVAVAVVEDEDAAASVDAFALDLLNASRAYATASKLPDAAAFAPAFDFDVDVDVDVCVPDPRNNCLNVSLALRDVVFAFDPSAASFLPVDVVDAESPRLVVVKVVVPLRKGSSSGCASATRLNCSIITRSGPVRSVLPFSRCVRWIIVKRVHLMVCFCFCFCLFDCGIRAHAHDDDDDGEKRMTTTTTTNVNVPWSALRDDDAMDVDDGVATTTNVNAVGALNDDVDDVGASTSSFLREHVAAATTRVAERHARECGMQLTPRASRALGELTMAFATELGRDLRAFAWHADRDVIHVKDVELRARKVTPNPFGGEDDENQIGGDVVDEDEPRAPRTKE